MDVVCKLSIGTSVRLSAICVLLRGPKLFWKSGLLVPVVGVVQHRALGDHHELVEVPEDESGAALQRMVPKVVDGAEADHVAVVLTDPGVEVEDDRAIELADVAEDQPAALHLQRENHAHPQRDAVEGAELRHLSGTTGFTHLDVGIKSKCAGGYERALHSRVPLGTWGAHLTEEHTNYCALTTSRIS